MENYNNPPAYNPHGYNNYQPQDRMPFQYQVSFSEAIRMGFDKYAQFSGRSSRSEFWWWMLFAWIIGLAGGVIDTLLGTMGIVDGILSLVLLIPGIAVAVRRLHDIGKGGGWYFILFIPLVGWIIFLVWMATDSEMAPNRFGPVPNVK